MTRCCDRAYRMLRWQNELQLCRYHMMRAQVTASLTLTLPLLVPSKNYEVISQGDQPTADHLRSSDIKYTFTGVQFKHYPLNLSSNNRAPSPLRVRFREAVVMKGSRSRDGSSSSVKSEKNRLNRDDSTDSTGNLARHLSLLSSKALKSVEDLVTQFGTMEAKVLEIEDMLSGDELPTREELCISMDALAQTAGDLDKLQMEKVDAVVTYDLSTGKDEVRRYRKDLTGRITALRYRVVALHKTVGTLLPPPQEVK